MRYFGPEEVRTLAPTPQRSCELAAQAMRWLASGEIEVPPKFGVHPPAGRLVHAMPAYCKPLDVAGLKWVADYPANRARGIPTVNAVIVLNDGATGVPYALLDGNWITAIRTAALTAVSLAACGARGTCLALIGTGLQAHAHVAMLPAALAALREIRVVGRTRASAESFIAAVQLAPPARLVVHDAIATAVDGADAIVTVTNEAERQLLDPAALERGVTIALVDNPAKEKALFAAAHRVVVDDRAPFSGPASVHRFKDGPPRIDAEIGKVLLGEERGRTSPDETVVIANLGNAALDIVFADDVYRSSRHSERSDAQHRVVDGPR